LNAPFNPDIRYRLTIWSFFRDLSLVRPLPQVTVRIAPLEKLPGALSSFLSLEAVESFPRLIPYPPKAADESFPQLPAYITTVT
jgi:hypothetical protein